MINIDIPESVVSPRRVALCLVVASACGTERADQSPVLVDIAAQTALDFKHFNGMSGQFYFSEIVGSGSALVDIDNDGDLDLYLVQGTALGPSGSSKNPDLSDRLMRNDLHTADSLGSTLNFADVTEQSRLSALNYGMGVATGDVDNDGWIDLYVTNFGSNQLWRNASGPSDGRTITLEDVTHESGTDDPRWSSSATFLDFDADGWLDLFVVSYTDFTIASHKACPDARGVPEYCGPRSYRPLTDRLFRNLGPSASGQVQFQDVSAKAGLLGAPGPGLGVVADDFNGDGLVDIYVANDQARNQLWINKGNGTFEDEALIRGCALDAQGRAQASMGVDAADVDGDGDVDLFMTHLMSETNTLYLNDGLGFFTEETLMTGLGSSSLPFTGFGTGFFDLDNDGKLDLLAVNGEVRTLSDQREGGDPLPLRQPNQLFRNTGDADGLRFEEWTQRAPVLELALVSRGAAFGDIDNDGDTDVVVQNNNAALQLLENRIGSEARWVGFRVVLASGRDALGARLGLHTQDGRVLWRSVQAGGSFLSANDPRVLFGLGGASNHNKGPLTAEVLWPSGEREQYEDLELGRYHTLQRGAGRPVEQP